MDTLVIRIRNGIIEAVPPSILAFAGVAAWFVSSFVTPYITSAEQALCLVPANETASIIGWVLAIFGLSSALAHCRGSLRVSNRQIAVMATAMVVVATVTSLGFVAFQQTNCAG